jgi:hypothetical protein
MGKKNNQKPTITSKLASLSRILIKKTRSAIPTNKKTKKAAMILRFFISAPAQLIFLNICAIYQEYTKKRELNWFPF